MCTSLHSCCSKLCLYTIIKTNGEFGFQNMSYGHLFLWTLYYDFSSFSEKLVACNYLYSPVKWKCRTTWTVFQYVDSDERLKWWNSWWYCFRQKVGNHPLKVSPVKCSLLFKMKIDLALKLDNSVVVVAGVGVGTYCCFPNGLFRENSCCKNSNGSLNSSSTTLHIFSLMQATT